MKSRRMIGMGVRRFHMVGKKPKIWDGPILLFYVEIMLLQKLKEKKKPRRRIKGGRREGNYIVIFLGLCWCTTVKLPSFLPTCVPWHYSWRLLQPPLCCCGTFLVKLYDNLHLFFLAWQVFISCLSGECFCNSHVTMIWKRVIKKFYLGNMWNVFSLYQ